VSGLGPHEFEQECSIGGSKGGALEAVLLKADLVIFGDLDLAKRREENTKEFQQKNSTVEVTLFGAGRDQPLQKRLGKLLLRLSNSEKVIDTLAVGIAKMVRNDVEKRP
jgi:hypothetical protein